MTRATQPQLIALRDGIRQSYNEDELKDICQNIGVDWGSLSGNFQVKVGQLVDHCQRKNVIEKLAAAVAELVTVEGLGSSAPAEQARSAEASGPSKIKILFVGSNPDNTEKLNLAEEMRTIDMKLRASPQRDLFQIEQAWAARSTDLIEAMLRYEPTVLHFSGHGLPDGLAFQDNDGMAKVVSGETLARIFTEFTGLRLVVMNACYSATQAEAIATAVPCVIGMKRPVGDHAAIDFAAGLYMSLGAGRPVKSAFNLARAQVELGDSVAEDRTPKLVVKTGTDPETMKLF